MKKTVAVFFMLFVAAATAENYLLQGGQLSEIQYAMEEDITPFPGITQLTASFVVPKSFSSPSYNMTVLSFDIQYSNPPSNQRKFVDPRGNEVLEVVWTNPVNPIKARIQLRTKNETRLGRLQTRALFPPENVPLDVRVYLQSTRQVPSDQPEIVETARRITDGAETEFDAVQQILTWLVDKMQYVLRPASFDALYSMRTGKGNCQNYSHLSAALMRAVGIPVRIVNGVTLKQPYDMEVTGGWMTMRMAEGRHSWIEVYFPDLGWVPFDPQQMQLFVSNRFIRLEVGLDNEETVRDGTIRWKRLSSASGQPKFQEAIATNFIQDNVRVAAERQTYGPHKILFSPRVESEFRMVTFKAEAAPSAVLSSAPAASYTVPDTLGNLDFPENADFLETRDVQQKPDSNEGSLQKNFLVESAEYVTTQGQKYAQSFILKEPIRLNQVGLALRHFGGAGEIWIEVMTDDGSGKPKDLICSSELMPTNQIHTGRGYGWVRFGFSGEPKTLQPGRYWIALAYTGSPVINWFFSYGKNVGPADGTRYNTLFEETWSRSLSYEFNFRVIGKRLK